jgi:hypothetical protein
MRHPMKELPLLDDSGEGFRSRAVEWGGLIVSYETFPKGTDAAPLFLGLPGGMCQSPHWGYIFKGRVRVKGPSGVEVLQAGDVYYLEPGHVPFFEDDTEVLEFSPKIEYAKTIEAFARNQAELSKRRPG